MNHTIIRESSNQYTIVEGEIRTLNVVILVSNRDFSSFDLTDNTEITVRFPAQNTNYIELTKTGGEVAVTNATAGQIAVTISATNSALMRKGDKQSFEVVVAFASSTRIAQVIGRLNVKSRIAC